MLLLFEGNFEKRHIKRQFLSSLSEAHTASCPVGVGCTGLLLNNRQITDADFTLDHDDL